MPRRAVAENRSETVLFRMRPSKREGLIKLAEHYDISEAEAIRRLIEPQIDEELAILAERTRLGGGTLRERSENIRLKLKKRTKLPPSRLQSVG